MSENTKILYMEIDGIGDMGFAPDLSPNIDLGIDSLGRPYAILSYNIWTPSDYYKYIGCDMYIHSASYESGGQVYEIIPDGFYPIDRDEFYNNNLIKIFLYETPVLSPGTYSPNSNMYYRPGGLYKWSTGLPDYVLEAEDIPNLNFPITDGGIYSREFWAPIISEFTPTIGQEINPFGGLGTGDGFSIDMVYSQDKFHREQFSTAISNNIGYSGSLFNYSYTSPFLSQIFASYFGSISTIEQYDTSLVPYDFNMWTTSDGYYDSVNNIYYIPTIQYIDEEAIASNLDLVSTRTLPNGNQEFEFDQNYGGQLNTQKLRHSEGSLIYTCPKALGRIASVYLIDKDELKYGPSSRQLIFRGLVDDIVTKNSHAEFTVSLSTELAQIWRNTNSSATSIIANNCIPQSEYANIDPQFLTSFSIDIHQTDKESRWRWIKFGESAIRLYGEDAVHDEYKPKYLYFDNSTRMHVYRYFVYRTIYFDFQKTGDWVTPDDILYSYSLASDDRKQLHKTNYIVLEHLESSEEQIKYYDTVSDDSISSGVDDIPRVLGKGATYYVPDGSYLEPKFLNRFLDEDLPVINKSIFRGLPDLIESLSVCHVFDNSFPDSIIDIPRTGIGYASGKKSVPGKILVNFIDVILQILMSTGEGTNTFTYNNIEVNPDVLPRDLGFGIPSSMIDIDSFMRINEINKISGQGNFAYCGYNLFIDSKNFDDVSKFLEDNILKPYYLGLVTGYDGKIRLVDLSSNSLSLDVENNLYDLPEIGESYLFNLTDDPYGYEISTAVETKYLTNNVAYNLERWIDTLPRANPANLQSKLNLQFNGIVKETRLDTSLPSYGTIVNYSRINRKTLQFKPKIFPAGKIVRVTNRWLENYNPDIFPMFFLTSAFLNFYTRPTYTLKLSVYQDALTDLGVNVGDFVILNIPNLYNKEGIQNQDEKVGLIKNWVHDINSGLVNLEILYFDSSVLDSILNSSRWSASGKIDSVTSNTEFSIGVNDFTINQTLSQELLFNEDIDSFNVADQIFLIDQYGSIKSQISGDPNVYEAREISTIVGNTITINSQFLDSAGNPVTPVVGDIILLANYETQTNELTRRIWNYCSIKVYEE